MTKTHKTKQATSSGIERRRILMASGAWGLSGLAGCKTIPMMEDGQVPPVNDPVDGAPTGNAPTEISPQGRTPESSLIAKAEPFQRRGRRALEQSRSIFRAADAGEPIERRAPGNILSPALTSAFLDYEHTKKRLLRKYSGYTKISYEDIGIDMGGAVASVMRAVLQDIVENFRKTANQSTGRILRKNGTKITIPHGMMLSYVQRGYCMDPSVPAPGKGDAMELWHVSERVPAELIPLYQAVGRWATNPRNKSGAQGLTWAIMGAGTDSGWAKNISLESLRKLDEAMPGGAGTFLKYHNSKLFARELLKALFKTAKLDKYLNPDLARHGSFEAAANAQLQYLIRLGQQDNSNMGSGYTMLAPNVAARATGHANLTPQVQIINASGLDFEYEVLDYFAQPLGKKQGVSTTADIDYVKGENVSVIEDKTWDDVVEAFQVDLEKFIYQKAIAHDYWTKKTPGAANATKKLTREVAAKTSLPIGFQKTTANVVASGVTFIPVVGNLLSGYEFLSGKDWLTGKSLSVAERGLALAGSVPGAKAFIAISKATKITDGKWTRAAGNSELFKWVDKTEMHRDIAAWIASDTVRTASEVSSNELNSIAWSAPTRDMATSLITMDAAGWGWAPETVAFIKENQALIAKTIRGR